MSQSEIKELNPPEAWEIMQQNPDATLFDVRTSMEYEYVGHPQGAVNIPWMEAPAWDIDQDFVAKVKQVLVNKSDSGAIESLPVLLICRSGKRSESAAEALIRQGFVDVTNVLEGFEGDRDSDRHRNTVNGWRFHTLPWEQS